MRPLSGMSHAGGSVRRTLRSRRQPSSEKPTFATRRRIPCRWSKRQSAPACERVASRMARSAGSSASSGATAAAAISRSCSRSTSPTEGGRAAGSAGPCGVAGRPGGRRGLRGKIAIARLCNACAAWTLAIPSPEGPGMAKNGHSLALPCREAKRVRTGAPAAARRLTSGGPLGMVPASMRSSRSSRVLMALACLSLATAARAADDSVPSLTASARAECDAGRRAPDREARKEHFDRGQALAERAVALDDNSAEAHFALFCNLGELMRLDGENLSQIFQLRRLMAEVDRTLELNPNHVDAMAAKGTLLVRLPRLLGGDSVRGEAMLREVLARDPNAFTTRLALANVCEARGDRQEALLFATRALQIAREQGRADKVAEAQAALAELRAAR